MDALNIKTVHWQEERIIPGTPWKIRGYSRSAYRTGFYIPDLDMMLDAGPQNFNKPKHILITHTHIDHIACLPLSMIGDETGNHIFNIYAIDKAELYIRNYIQSMFEANAMTDTIKSGDWYKFVGKKSGDTFDINVKGTDLVVSVFECDHKIPTISYGFTETKQKLKDEYKGLSGKEIGGLRKKGVPVTELVKYPRFCYICDTSIKVFELNPEILGYNVIMIECTFLYPDELDNAIATQHIHWLQLEPYVKRHTDIKFILFHFSQRYRDVEIDQFFNDQDCPNVTAWTIHVKNE